MLGKQIVDVKLEVVPEVTLAVTRPGLRKQDGHSPPLAHEHGRPWVISPTPLWTILELEARLASYPKYFHAVPFPQMKDGVGPVELSKVLLPLDGTQGILAVGAVPWW